MLQQNIWHIAKYQDNKNYPKFVQTAKHCKPVAARGEHGREEISSLVEHIELSLWLFL